MAVAIVCYSSFARAECTKDVDCDGDNVCEAGQCTAPAPPAEPAAATPPLNPQAAPARRAAPAPAPVYFFDEGKSPDKVEKRLKNPIMLVGGILMASAGVGLVLYGSVIESTDGGHVPMLRPPQLVGLLCIGAGVPLIVIGSKREPAPTAVVSGFIAPQHGGLQLRLNL